MLREPKGHLFSVPSPNGVQPTIDVELDPEADVAFPYNFENNVVPEEDFTTLSDNQLTVAHEEVIEEVGSADR